MHSIKKKLDFNYFNESFNEIKIVHHPMMVHEFYELINDKVFPFLIILKMVHKLNCSKCFKSLLLIEKIFNLVEDFVLKDIKV